MIEAKKIVESAHLNMDDKTNVIQQVRTIMAKLQSKPINDWSMDSLVNHMFTLAKIMDNLSDLKDMAILYAEAKEEEYETSVRDKYLEIKEGKQKVSEAMAKALAEKECDNIKGELLINKYQARRLTDLYKDCERLISFSQSKIKSLTGGMVRANTTS